MSSLEATKRGRKKSVVEGRNAQLSRATRGWIYLMPPFQQIDGSVHLFIYPSNAQMTISMRPLVWMMSFCLVGAPAYA